MWAVVTGYYSGLYIDVGMAAIETIIAGYYTGYYRGHYTVIVIIIVTGKRSLRMLIERLLWI